MATTPLLSDLPLATTLHRLRSADRATLARHVEDVLSRAAACEPALRALVAEDGRAARLLDAMARLIERFPEPAARPPLFGALTGIKDVIAVDGLPTRAGSALPAEAFTMPEATVVRRLREAGALVLGKTVSAEFASLSPGPTANPHDTGHTPGGSSSGSAAGVAVGYFPLAVGTQTAGSIVRPAAFCGIVGFKPSSGRIPTDGVLPHSPSVDTLGLFTQDVEGVAIAASVLLDGWRAVPAAEARDLVLLVPEGAYLDLAEAAGRDAFEQGVARLAGHGVTVRRGPFMDDAVEILQRHGWMQDAEFAREHEERFARYAHLFTGGGAAQYDRGRRVTEGQLRAGRDGRAELRDRLHHFLDQSEADLLVCPSAPGPAPAGLNTTGDPRMNAPWTHAGVPAISLPAGQVAGLPVGLQLVGRSGADEELLAAALAITPLL